MTDINNIKVFSVIGSGHMGRGIAQAALASGNFDKVIINDISDEALKAARSYIEIGMKKLEEKGKMENNQTAEDVVSTLIIERDLKTAVESSDFIIEVIPEKMNLKQDLFRKLGEFSPEHAILATNTSTMSITEIASTSGRDDKVVGMHFFTPVVLLRLIEVIKGKHTSDDTFEKCCAIGQTLPALRGKRYIARILKESPGFIVNRLNLASNLYLNWIIDHAAENGIPFEGIDADMGFISGLGICAKLDYLGLDVVYNVMKYFEKTLSPEFKPLKTLSRLVNEGNLGAKTGKGLYEWKNGAPILKPAEKSGLFDPELYLAIQLNEGCRLLNEGIVSGFKIIDDAMLAGMDVPGPFSSGKRNFGKWAQKLEDFSKKSGFSYFLPCDLMKMGGFIKMRK